MNSRNGNSAAFEAPAVDAPPASESLAKPKKSPSPRNCRDFIRRETASAMFDIVDKFVDQAKAGSVSHFNALTKVGGFDQGSAKSAAPKTRRRSLARQLLDEVERYEAKKAAQLAAANAPSSETSHSKHDDGPQEIA